MICMECKSKHSDVVLFQRIGQLKNEIEKMRGK
jgi:hypothetical protein